MVYLELISENRKCLILPEVTLWGVELGFFFFFHNSEVIASISFSPEPLLVEKNTPCQYNILARSYSCTWQRLSLLILNPFYSAGHYTYPPGFSNVVTWTQPVLMKFAGLVNSTNPLRLTVVTGIISVSITWFSRIGVFLTSFCFHITFIYLWIGRERGWEREDSGHAAEFMYCTSHNWNDLARNKQRHKEKHKYHTDFLLYVTIKVKTVRVVLIFFFFDTVLECPWKPFHVDYISLQNMIQFILKPCNDVKGMTFQGATFWKDALFPKKEVEDFF